MVVVLYFGMVETARLLLPIMSLRLDSSQWMPQSPAAQVTAEVGSNIFSDPVFPLFPPHQPPPRPRAPPQELVPLGKTALRKFSYLLWSRSSWTAHYYSQLHAKDPSWTFYMHLMSCMQYIVTKGIMWKGGSVEYFLSLGSTSTKPSLFLTPFANLGFPKATLMFDKLLKKPTELTKSF